MKGESAFHAGFVMQFSAMLCTHMMRVCHSVHDKFVTALCYEDAFAIVREAISGEDPGVMAASEIDVPASASAGCVTLPFPPPLVLRLFFLSASFLDVSLLLCSLLRCSVRHR